MLNVQNVIEIAATLQSYASQKKKNEQNKTKHIQDLLPIHWNAVFIKFFHIDFLLTTEYVLKPYTFS